MWAGPHFASCGAYPSLCRANRLHWAVCRAANPTPSIRMDSLKREALRMQTVALTGNMNPGILGPYLYSKSLLTHDEFERLQLPTMTTRDRNLFILQRIPSKGSRAFDLFVECLRESGRDNGEETHTNLADRLQQQLDAVLPP